MRRRLAAVALSAIALLGFAAATAAPASAHGKCEVIDGEVLCW